MDESFTTVLRTIFKDLFPIESIKASRESLSAKDWNVFARMFSLIGFIIQIVSVCIIAIVFILRDVLSAPTFVDGVSLMFSRIVPIAILLYVGTWMISPPLDEVTGKKEPQTDSENHSPVDLSIYGFFWGSLSIAWRYAIYVVDIDPFSGGVAFSVGKFIGLILSDSIYFGGLMVASGFIAQAYLWTRK